MTKARSSVDSDSMLVTVLRLQEGNWLQVGVFAEETEARLAPFDEVPVSVLSWWPEEPAATLREPSLVHRLDGQHVPEEPRRLGVVVQLHLVGELPVAVLGLLLDEHREVETLRRELAAAQAQGEAYARELAAVMGKPYHVIFHEFRAARRYPATCRARAT